MTAVVLLVLAWAFLAASMAFVIGHGIRLADALHPVRSGGDELWSPTEDRQAVAAS